MTAFNLFSHGTQDLYPTIITAALSALPIIPLNELSPDELRTSFPAFTYLKRTRPGRVIDYRVHDDAE
jgi:hypothetical protein